MEIEAVLDKENAGDGVGDESDEDDVVINQEGSNDGPGLNRQVEQSVLEVEWINFAFTSAIIYYLK